MLKLHSENMHSSASMMQKKSVKPANVSTVSFSHATSS